jgi:2-dehydro-3-deoxyphosphogluconate aldolase / (4S)-4-hydroxy-2-oxoglutarate aldolase
VVIFYQAISDLFPNGKETAMARFSRMQVLNAIYETSLVPVFYHADIETARQVIATVSRGGCRLIEFVNRGDHAFEVFSALEKHFRVADPDLILGAGTILDPCTASLYINAGANFIVGPTLHPEVARICNRRKIPYSPGCGSASEISQAEELGCEICKIFPGEEVGGPKFVSSVLGPMPWSSLMPTGGVDPTPESITQWVNAGVVAMGIGSKLITAEAIKAKDWNGIEKKVRTTMELIKEAKRNKPARQSHA